jgi:hypothetical protein
MANIQREGNLITLDGRVRIEAGPTLNKATATKELLDNTVTAEHYQPEAFDAMGKPIVLGEEMHYLDWVGHTQGTEGSTSWYVYRLEDLTTAELKERGIDKSTAAPEDLTIWREKAAAGSEDEALGLAIPLLNG